MKVLILDSGPLINLSMNGLLYLLEKLKKSSNIEMLITDKIIEEVVKRPSNIPRFELGALQINELIKSGIVKAPEYLEINSKQLSEETKKVMGILNSSITAKGKCIKLVSEAESSCLALSKILNERNIENIIAIDEKTTRILLEKPENLEKVMSEKLHTKIKISYAQLNRLDEFKFIRSSELVYVAYKLGLTEIKGEKVLEAMLYATKFKGTSISWDEISVLKKL